MELLVFFDQFCSVIPVLIIKQHMYCCFTAYDFFFGTHELPVLHDCSTVNELQVSYCPLSLVDFHRGAPEGAVFLSCHL